ncbi:hypothetical protein [Desulfonatronum sp. SC1]|uniref:hypothetical protein n=1 Tax=Desulfonatronum sp. SC1 TaxID=2109626 RepID=UPI000D317A60|nr:hypothetical protein [Desulfonatronum sp. SC1]PTN38293.1 hypothetical protein C6366_03540 [Desulfonatronum sp. SC1]
MNGLTLGKGESVFVFMADQAWLVSHKPLGKSGVVRDCGPCRFKVSMYIFHSHTFSSRHKKQPCPTPPLDLIQRFPLHREVYNSSDCFDISSAMLLRNVSTEETLVLAGLGLEIG